MSVSKRPSDDVAPPRSGIPGFMFVMDGDTFNDCMKTQIFGIGKEMSNLDLPNMIGPLTKLFVYNFTTKRLSGVLLPTCAPAAVLDGDSLSARTRPGQTWYMQVRVTLMPGLDDIGYQLIKRPPKPGALSLDQAANYQHVVFQGRKIAASKRRADVSVPFAMQRAPAPSHRSIVEEEAPAPPVVLQNKYDVSHLMTRNASVFLPSDDFIEEDLHSSLETKLDINRDQPDLKKAKLQNNSSTTAGGGTVVHGLWKREESQRYFDRMGGGDSHYSNWKKNPSLETMEFESKRQRAEEDLFNPHRRSILHPRDDPLSSGEGVAANTETYDVDIVEDTAHRERTVVIHGQDVAFTHADTCTTDLSGFKNFRGIQLCVDYFEGMGIECMVFLPTFWKCDQKVDGLDIFKKYQKLEQERKLIFTPEQDGNKGDDSFLLNYARQKKFTVVSCDMFRDKQRSMFQDFGAWQQWSANFQLTYSFVFDDFLPNHERISARKLDLNGMGASSGVASMEGQAKDQDMMGEAPQNPLLG